MKLKVGDKVVVITGANKGKDGKIVKTFKADNKIIVENVHMIKKHVKPNGGNAGSIVSMEAPIDASNVMLVDSKTNKRTRIGHSTLKNNKKIRVAKKSNEKLD